MDALSSLAAPGGAMTDPAMLAGALDSPAALSLKMGAGATSAQIDSTAQNFEAMFATQMLQPMFDGMQVDKTFGGGHGEEVMRSFLLQAYGKIIAKTDALHIEPQIKAEMLRSQEQAGGALRGRKTAPSAAASAAAAYARNANATLAAAPAEPSAEGDAHVAVQ
ncbi:MAG: hypothetical protein KGI37_08295 [Alphaproteobacteria bacterium]|nr:hypothetical protein [Alphaproteobacteria bacterium]